MFLLEARDGPRASGLVVSGDVEPAFGAPVLWRESFRRKGRLEYKKATKQHDALTVPQLLRPIQYCKRQYVTLRV